MAKVSTQIDEYVGISNTTITDGTTAVIEVLIPEFLPITGGNLDEYSVAKSKLVDPTIPNAEPEESSIIRSKTVTCHYFGSGDKNQLIPCVAKGERVRVFNFGGSETYYWRGAGRDVGLRRTERVRWFAMDLPTTVSGGEYPDLNDDNCYFIEMNTNKGDRNIRIHTSISNEEEFPYDITIYPSESKLEITDNNGGQYILLETKERRWTLMNKDESQIVIDKENITLKCKDTITLDAGNNIICNAGKDITSTAGSNITSKASADITDDAGGNMTYKAASNGTIEAGSALTEKGADVSITGSSSTNVKGPGGDCEIATISLTKHKHPVPPHCPSAGMTVTPVP